MKTRQIALIAALAVAVCGCQSQSAGLRAAGSISAKDSAETRESRRREQAVLMAGAGGSEDDSEDLEAFETNEAAQQDDEAADERSYADDSARCGDGVLDVDELCDTSIPERLSGACPMECKPPAGCPHETLVIRGCWTRCVPETMPDAACLQAMEEQSAQE